MDYSYGEYVHAVIKNETIGMDEIYEDYVIHLVGTYGLHYLKEHKLVQSCGKVNGRALVTLCKKES